MKFKHSWLIWMILIFLLILTFPKSCGNKIPSEFIEYNCLGFRTPFLSQIEKSQNPQKWCSGFCFSKTKKMIESNKTKEDLSGGFLGGMIEPFIKVIPTILLVFSIIFIIRWITSVKKKNRGDIKVYRNP